MLLRLAALAAILFLAAPAPAACACSCGGTPINQITLAIRGEVIAVEVREVRPDTQFGVATVRVSDVLRGPADLETVRISYLVGDGINCGVGFTRGYRGFIAATGAEGHYGASLCSWMSEAQFREAQR